MSAIEFKLLDQADGNTPISAEEVDALIPSLSTRSELNEWERENILSAYNWCYDRLNLVREEPLTEAYVRKLHKKMFGQTWKWAGSYRQTEKNIGVNCHKIVEMLANLLADAIYWMENKTFSVDEIAARFHHRLVQIHPFPNGNGRHARLMADVILARLGHPQFSWGQGDLSGQGDLRSKYISALKAADAGDIQPLLKFVRS